MCGAAGNAPAVAAKVTAANLPCGSRRAHRAMLPLLPLPFLAGAAAPPAAAAAGSPALADDDSVALTATEGRGDVRTDVGVALLVPTHAAHTTRHGGTARQRGSSVSEGPLVLRVGGRTQPGTNLMAVMMYVCTLCLQIMQVPASRHVCGQVRTARTRSTAGCYPTRFDLDLILGTHQGHHARGFTMGSRVQVLMACTGWPRKTACPCNARQYPAT
jgi:hypothetical protein